VTRRRYWVTSYMVAPDKAMNHIKYLRANGMSLPAIAAAAGISRPRSLWEVSAGRRKQGILATTETRVLAVRLQQTVVPALGVQRRVQALAALGYTTGQIAAEARIEKCVIDRALRGVGKTMQFSNGEPVVQAFNRLQMTPATGPQAVRQRNYAKKARWAPPLAWDHIDDPKARPVGMTHDSRSRYTMDEVAVQRRMAGDRTVHVHGEETREVVRRLAAQGYQYQWIEEQTGLKTDRYRDAYHAGRAVYLKGQAA
jgi:hypothetical protein